MSFLEGLKRQVANQNNSAAEEGDYSAVLMTLTAPGTWMFQFVDLTSGTEVRAYIVKIGQLEGPYVEALMAQAWSDPECSLAGWPVNEAVIAEVGQRILAHEQQF